MMTIEIMLVTNIFMLLVDRNVVTAIMKREMIVMMAKIIIRLMLRRKLSKLIKHGMKL